MKALVKELKELDQDFEWYPTTQKMIDCIKKDMVQYFNQYEDREIILSSVNVLDCGAGDGRVVRALANGGKTYAIEKSRRLIKAMPAGTFIIGTEFFQTTLIDKKTDVLFCNPPYSEYIQWAQKVILEANAQMIYLILPTRWQGSNVIKKALESRETEGKVIGSYNFLDAERSARAKVNIIAIKLIKGRGHNKYKNTDPFGIWFDENFKLKEAASPQDPAQAKTFKEKLQGQLTTGRGLAPILVGLYNKEMEHLQKMFLSVCELDPDILTELGVSSKSLKEALKQRIKGLKIKYWHELFDNYDKITKRLTHGSRKTMLEKLTNHTSIDFTESNIYAVTIWVIKNANKYYDQQLIELVENMINDANVKLYKSNKRVFTDQDWRYCGRKPNHLSHYSLELRIILHHIGGIKVTGAWSSWDYINNLSKRAHDFLDDICTIASNLGFELPAGLNSAQITDEWLSNKAQNFDSLISVKAFKNGNLHIKFNQDFIRTLNVEFGRLKGWLTNHIQASEELSIPVKQTKKLFKANYQLTQTNGLLQIGVKK